MLLLFATNDCWSSKSHIHAVGRQLGVSDVSTGTAYRAECTVERACLSSLSAS